MTTFETLNLGCSFEKGAVAQTLRQPEWLKLYKVTRRILRPGGSPQLKRAEILTKQKLATFQMSVGGVCFIYTLFIQRWWENAFYLRKDVSASLVDQDECFSLLTSTVNISNTTSHLPSLLASFPKPLGFSGLALLIYSFFAGLWAPLFWILDQDQYVLATMSSAVDVSGSGLCYLHTSLWHARETM